MEKVAAVAPQGVNCKTFSSNFSHRRLLKKTPPCRHRRHLSVWYGVAFWRVGTYCLCLSASATFHLQPPNFTPAALKIWRFVRNVL
jgi:hypothetical protein